MARSVETFPRCATCCFWLQERDPSYRLDEGTCWKTETGMSIGDERDSLAHADDASGYHAILRTHETFGCVMHQPHEG